MFVGGVSALTDLEWSSTSTTNPSGKITACGVNLVTPNKVYYIDANSPAISLTSTFGEPCIKISADGITLNLNGATLSASSSSSSYGIWVANSNIIVNGSLMTCTSGTGTSIIYASCTPTIINNLVQKDSKITGFKWGIYIQSGSNNNQIIGIRTYTNTQDGIAVQGSSGNFFKNITSYDNTQYGLNFQRFSGNYFTDISTTNNKVGEIFFSASSHNKFNDSSFSNTLEGNKPIISLDTNSLDNIFLNCSYDNSKESIDSTSELIRKWRTGFIISDHQGFPASNTNINIQGTGSTEILTTDSNGNAYTELAQYKNTGSKSMYTPFAITVTRAGYPDIAISSDTIIINPAGKILGEADLVYRGDLSQSTPIDFLQLNSNLFATKDIGKTYYNTTSIKLNVSADRELALTNPCTVKLYLDKDYNGNYADSEIISSATGDSMIRSTNKKIEATLAKILTSGNYQAKFSCSSTATSTTVATTGELTVDFTINVPLSLQLTSPAKDKFVGGKYIGGKYSGTYPMDSINLAVSGNNNLKECFADFNKTDKIKTCPAVESETESSESETEESEETEPCYEYEPIESVPMASVSGDLNKMSATYSPFAAGNYIINITCTDTYNAGTDEEEIKRHINNSISFKLESSPQAGGGLSVSSPKSSSEAVYAGKQNLLFKLNANENINACNVSWDNFVKINRTMIEGIVNTVPNNIFSYTSNSSDIFSDGSYTANFSCSVGANNKIESVTINFKIDSIPDLIINFPEDEETYENPEFEFDVSLDSENYIPPFVLDSCIFSIDEGVTNYTMDYINNVNQNFTLDITSDGDYTAIFWCDYSSDPFVSSLAGTITREIEFELDRTSIGTPSSFSALAISSDKIGLSWKDNSFTEQGFKIERKISGGTYSEITNVSANSALYTDTGLDSNTTYFYKIRAYNMSMTDSFYSGYSNEINANTFAEAVSANAGEDTTPAPQCGENNLNLCISKSNCENADGYWYNSACHEEAQQTQTSSSKAGEGKAGFLSGILATTGSTLFYVQISVGIVILIILIFLIVKFFGKKKPQQMPQHHAAQINPVQK